MNHYFLLDLPAGAVVDFLVGFSNKGAKDFTIDTIDASFRYPMDFNFFIQNVLTENSNSLINENKIASRLSNPSNFFS